MNQFEDKINKKRNLSICKNTEKNRKNSKFLELPGGALDKARSREARPSDGDRELEARCAVHGFLFLQFFALFLTICIVFPIFLCCFAN